MQGIEKHIRKALEEHGKTREKRLGECVRRFMAKLEGVISPAQGECDAAAGEAETTLKKPLFASLDFGDDTAGRSRRASIESGFTACMPRLKVVAPAPVMELVPGSTALTAALGAAIGMMLFSFLARIIFGQDYALSGLIVGAPLGAYVLIRAMMYISGAKWVRRFILAALGLATLAELWMLLGGGGIFRIWRMVRGKSFTGKALKRILIYILVMLMIIGSRRRPVGRTEEIEKAARKSIGDWIDAAVRLLAALTFIEPEKLTDDPDRGRGALKELLEHVHVFEQAQGDALRAAADDFINTARNLGFSTHAARQGEELRWQESMGDTYDTFGHIEAGDLVQVEKPAEVRGREVISRGRVRKVRGEQS
ncbi:MAG: hypothetical protein ACYS8W_08045 [Planctomycetota bacterium]|jgi:hypothetical protein